MAAAKRAEELLDTSSVSPILAMPIERLPGTDTAKGGLRSYGRVVLS